MDKRLAILFICVFVVMMGYGITLPVLTFYIERLALADGASSQLASIHVGVLTGVFALMQFPRTSRAERLQRFLTQPLFVTESFNNKPGAKDFPQIQWKKIHNKKEKGADTLFFFLQ